MFVFPSRTDTFGLVLLEALASGVPVAGFPAAAPRDVIGEAPVGVLDEDLRLACLGALECSRDDCREFALSMTWEASARMFLEPCRGRGQIRARETGPHRGVNICCHSAARIARDPVRRSD